MKFSNETDKIPQILSPFKAKFVDLKKKYLSKAVQIIFGQRTRQTQTSFNALYQTLGTMNISSTFYIRNTFYLQLDTKNINQRHNFYKHDSIRAHTIFKYNKYIIVCDLHIAIIIKWNHTKLYYKSCGLSPDFIVIHRTISDTSYLNCWIYMFYCVHVNENAQESDLGHYILHRKKYVYAKWLRNELTESICLLNKSICSASQ